uniref:Fr.III-4 n=1 Tax=Trichonephila clavipes TaxID=2585209 RepID=BRK4_TRICX|nr:RecName: Full=Fr.III-4 [Trichonephila clavipes]
LTPETASFPR